MSKHHSQSQLRSSTGEFLPEGDEPKGKPVCVALPLWADELVREKKNRSQWLQEVICNALSGE